MDSSYNIFVADTHNDLVRRYNPFGKVCGHLGHEPDRAPGAARRDRIGVLDRPRAVGVHGDTVFVACGDRKLRRGVQCFHRDGRVMKPLLPFGETEGRWGAPQGISATAKGVFVADTLHGVIQRFRSHGMYVSQFSTALKHDEASRPIAVEPLESADLLVLDDGDEPGLRRFSIGGEPLPLGTDVIFEDPVDIAVDEVHRVYVLDRNGVRVQRLLPDLSFDCEIVDLAEITFG